MSVLERNRNLGVAWGNGERKKKEQKLRDQFRRNWVKWEVRNAS